MTRNDKLLVVLVASALIGFAANSLLCRAALETRAIDAASFTAIRMASGAVVLFLFAFFAVLIAPSDVVLYDEPRRHHGDWASAFALFAYAIAFSLAYLRLTAATGALLLFASVQVTMIGTGIVRGTRPRPREWIGIAVALGGLVALLAPGIAAPDPYGAIAMIVAGASWGIYSLRGAALGGPTKASMLSITAHNFRLAVPFAAIAVVAMLALSDLHVSRDGIVLAIASGAIASGLGYTFWYSVLHVLRPTHAAVVQLAVPVLTAIAAVLLLDETLTLRFAIAATAILGGIAIVVGTRR